MKYYTYLILIFHPVYGRIYYGGKSVAQDPYTHIFTHLGHCSNTRYISWKRQHKEWFTCRVLQIFDNPKEQSCAEQTLILKLLSKHGSFYHSDSCPEFYKYISRQSYNWLRTFGSGSCINAHASDCGVASYAALEKIKTTGFSEAQKNQHFRLNKMIDRTNAIRASHTKDVCLARNKTIQEHGTRNTISGCMAARAKILSSGLSDKQRAYRSSRHDNSAMMTPEAAAKRALTRVAQRPIYLLSDGFTGDYVSISEHLNMNKDVVSKWLRGKIATPLRCKNITFEIMKK